MSWSEEIELVCDECPEVKHNKPKVIIKQQALVKIIMLLHKFPHIEWGAYCIGSKDKEAYYIEDLKIPKQEVDKANVEFKETNFPKNCIGWIHSHNNMDAFLSATDKASASIYDVTIVVNNKLEFAVAVKIKLSCGRCALADTTVEIELGKELEQELANIVEKKEEIKVIEIDYKDRICVVCGQKLPKKKKKLKYCKMCNNWVHNHCYIDDLKMCLNCFEEFELRKSYKDNEWETLWYKPFRDYYIE